jgi:beta-glucosidase-like glycosyl hydrolase
LIAGNDMLAICAKEEAIRDGFNAVSKAIADGEIAESRIDDSLRRIASLKSKLSAPVDFNIERLNEISEQMLKLSARLN